jgi:hypothetical protein
MAHAPYSTEVLILLLEGRCEILFRTDRQNCAVTPLPRKCISHRSFVSMKHPIGHVEQRDCGVQRSSKVRDIARLRQIVGLDHSPPKVGSRNELLCYRHRQSSSASRFTAGAAGFFILSQSDQRLLR